MIENIEIIKTVKDYIVKTSFSKSEDIHNDTLIFENSLLDSMGFLFLIDFLNEEFKIEIEDKDLVNKNFESINSISEFIYGKLKTFDIVKEKVI